MLSVAENVSQAALTVGPLESPVPAPTVGEIMSNPDDLASRENYPFYAHRVWQLEGSAAKEDDPESVVATTEASALTDFVGKMSIISDFLDKYGRDRGYQVRADHAPRLKTDLAFIGGKEFDQAIDAIAEHWLNVIGKSQYGELSVVVDLQGSSIFIFDAVRKAMAAKNPDAPAQLRPLNRYRLKMLTDDEKARLKTDGIRVLDDWIISGSQLEGEVYNVNRYVGDKDKIEVDLICARDTSLQEGVEGVKCNAYYSYHYFSDRDIGRLSLTGSHCNTDFGFMDGVGLCYQDMLSLSRKLREEGQDPGDYELMPHPLLYYVARRYGHDRFGEGFKLPDESDEFRDLGKSIEFFRDLHAKNYPQLLISYDH